MPLSREAVLQYERAITDPVFPALSVGAISGASGLGVGVVLGTLHSAHPGFFAAFTGLQWFGLGSTFWYFRSAMIIGAAGGRPTRRQELGYSAAAGSLAGGINGVFRSRSNIVPAAIVAGILGLVGQYGYHSLADDGEPVVDRVPILHRLAASKWVPLKSLSDQEYEQILQDKLLATEAEISMIDASMAALKSSQGTVKGEISTADPC